MNVQLISDDEGITGTLLYSTYLTYESLRLTCTVSGMHFDISLVEIGLVDAKILEIGLFCYISTFFIIFASIPAGSIV